MENLSLVKLYENCLSEIDCVKGKDKNMIEEIFENFKERIEDV